MNKTDTLILRLNFNDYFFPFIEYDSLRPVFKNRAERIIFTILFPLVTPSFPFLSDWKKEINKYKNVIIFDYGWSNQITHYIKKYNQDCRIILFYFNHINNKNHIQMLNDKCIDELWTFDFEDSQKYDIKLNTTFYTYNVPINRNAKLLYDLVFVGNDKGRKKIIDEIVQYCNEKDLTTQVVIPHQKSEYISYMQYIELISHSKAILDITLKAQKGFTLRVMESIFLEKKLITNNEMVMDSTFYNENNVFVLGKRDINELESFLNTPYIKLSKELVDYYQFKNWLTRFNIEGQYGTNG